MNIRELKNSFFNDENIVELVKLNKLKTNKKDFIIYGKNEDYSYYIQFLYLTHGAAGISIQPYLSVSNENIFKYINSNEVLVKKVYGNCRINLEVIEYFYKFGEDYALKLIDDMKDRYIVKDKNTLAYFIDDFTIKIDSFLDLYTRTYSNIDKIDSTYNNEPLNKSIHQDSCMLYQILSAITAAKIINNPNYDLLLNIYNDYLKDASPHWKNAWEKNLLSLDNL